MGAKPPREHRAPRPAHVDPQPEHGKDAEAPGHNKVPDPQPEPPVTTREPGKFGGTI